MLNTPLTWTPPELLNTLKDKEIRDPKTKEILHELTYSNYLTKSQLKKIARWKSPRSTPLIEKNPEQKIIQQTKKSFSVHPNTTSRATINKQLRPLLQLSGVGLPTASTILYFRFPDTYPIMDVNARKALALPKKSTYSLEDYVIFCEKIDIIRKNTCLDLRTIDVALWQFGKNKRNPSGETHL